MYDPTDPRSSLASAPAAAARMPDVFDPAQVGLFYAEPPQETDASGSTWYIRGQNFLVAYTEAKPGAVLARKDQPDEYVMVIHAKETIANVTAGREETAVSGHSITVIPPGDSSITLPDGGAIVRLFTTASADLAARCSNAAAYAEAHATVAPLNLWPAPPDGFRIRSYSMDIAQEPGRFGRIFRCTTFMVNYLDPQIGPRDVTKLSPHHHDDFEQCSLAVEGSFIHHLRWPWTTNLNNWRADEAVVCASPSVTVIPPPSIHTTRGMEPGCNQLIDIFCPPRIDFSEKPGWVLNAGEYPMPKSSG
jgi:hypothetical protein